MKKTTWDKSVGKDFQAFLANEPVSPPEHLSHQILERVTKELNPNPWEIFAKLSFLHLLTGIATLMICPQFGVKIFSENMGLMSVFQAFGTYGCMITCGFFFLGSSIFVAILSLKPEEIRVIRNNRFLELGGLIFISLGFFLMVNPEILFGFAISWVFGSVLGSLTVLEVGWILRTKT